MIKHTYTNAVDPDEAFLDRIFPVWSCNSKELQSIHKKTLWISCFKINIKKERKNLKIILKYTCLKDSSKHELEQEMGGTGK